MSYYALLCHSMLPIKNTFRTLDWDGIKEELGLIGNLMQLANDFN